MSNLHLNCLVFLLLSTVVLNIQSSIAFLLQLEIHGLPFEKENTSLLPEEKVLNARKGYNDEYSGTWIDI